MRTKMMVAGLGLVALLGTACGSDAPDAEGGLPTDGGGGAAGACLVGAEDCQDTGGDMGAPPPSSMCAEDAPDCDDTVVSPPNEDLPADGAPDEPEPRFVEPKGDLIDVHPVAWNEVAVDEDDQAITVQWWSGVEPCHALSKVSVDYTDEAVTITVLEGAEESDVACIEIAELKAYRIQLDEPLGPRSILDGADG